MARMKQADLREIDDASNFAVDRQQEMVNLAKQVADMGSFRLWWDSMVPENEQGFFNRISWKSSDRQAIGHEIAKHRDFYEDMRIAIRQVRNGEEEVEELIEDLYERLLEMQRESEAGIGSTNSKTLQRLHREFVEKHQVLENRIRRVEVVAVRQQLKRARDEWRQAVDEIREVKQNMEQTRDENRVLTERFERLLTFNEEIVNQYEDLRRENGQIRNILEELVRNGTL